MTTPAKEKRFNWAIPAFLVIPAFIALVAFLQVMSTRSPDNAALAQRCGSCHQMNEQVDTWKASAHKDVACTACHEDRGVWGVAHSILGQERMRAVSRWRDPEAGQIETAVPNARCIACHGEQMPYVMIDLKPPPLGPVGQVLPALARSDLDHLPALAAHDEHLTLPDPLSCNDCHAGVSHAPVERTERERFNHEICLTCHTEQRVQLKVEQPVTCAACHLDTRAVVPQNHKAESFRLDHGDRALQPVAACNQCHLSGTIAPAISVAELLTFPDGHPVPAPNAFTFQAQGAAADACQACHRVPMPHPPGYIAAHGASARSNPGSCQACHGAANPAGARPAVARDDFCSKCHAVEMPHPQGFLAQHDSVAEQSPAACSQCHSSANPSQARATVARDDFCSSCHTTAMPHPTEYLARHGDAAQSAGASCDRCHSGANPARPQASYASAQFCQSCHVAEMPHPENWQTAHGQAFSENAATCDRCHSDANPANPSAVHASPGYCVNCHASTALPQPYHADKMWFIKHGDAVSRQGDASCLTCHAKVEPLCSKCHSGR